MNKLALYGGEKAKKTPFGTWGYGSHEGRCFTVWKQR